MSPNWSAPAPAPAPAQVRSSSFPPRQLPSSLLPGAWAQPPATHQQFPCCWLLPVEPRHYAGPPRDHVFTAQQSAAGTLWSLDNEGFAFPLTAAAPNLFPVSTTNSTTGPTTACSSQLAAVTTRIRGRQQEEETFVSCCYETMPMYCVMRQVVPGPDIRYGHREQSPGGHNGKAPPHQAAGSLLTFSADTGRGMGGEGQSWSRFPARDKESSQDQLSRPSTSQPHYSFHIPSSAAEEWRRCQVLSSAIYTIYTIYTIYR